MNSRWSSDGDYDVELSSEAELHGRKEVDKMAKKEFVWILHLVSCKFVRTLVLSACSISCLGQIKAHTPAWLDHRIKFKSYSTLVKLQKPFLEIMKKPTNVHKSQHEI